MNEHDSTTAALDDVDLAVEIQVLHSEILGRTRQMTHLAETSAGAGDTLRRMALDLRREFARYDRLVDEQTRRRMAR